MLSHAFHIMKEILSVNSIVFQIP